METKKRRATKAASTPSGAKRKRTVKKGRCRLCCKEGTKASIIKHTTQEIKKTASPVPPDSTAEKRFLIQIEGARYSHCWRFIVVRGSTPCSELKEYVKSYINCGCGHMESWTGPDEGNVEDKLTVGGGFSYGIDIVGSPTNISASVVDSFITGPPSAPEDNIRKIAESIPQPKSCWTCGNEAEVYCSECQANAQLYDDQPGFLCRECATDGEEHACAKKDKDNGEEEEEEEEEESAFSIEDHLITNDKILNVINSPRFGICGFV